MRERAAPYDLKLVISTSSTRTRAAMDGPGDAHAGTTEPVSEPPSRDESKRILREIVLNWATAHADVDGLDSEDSIRVAEEKTQSIMEQINVLVDMLARASSTEEASGRMLKEMVNARIWQLIVPIDEVVIEEIDEMMTHVAHEKRIHNQALASQSKEFPSDDAMGLQRPGKVRSGEQGEQRRGTANADGTSITHQSGSKMEQLLEALVQSHTALARSNATAAERQQDQDEESHQFLNRLRKVSGVQRPPSINMAKASLSELSHWVETLLIFIQHVDHKSKGLSAIINKLKVCCYASGVADTNEHLDQLWKITDMAAKIESSW